jgi:hypothetical protein
MIVPALILGLGVQEPQIVPLWSLLGRTPAQVASMLGADGPAGPGLRLSESGRSIVIHPGEPFRPPWPQGRRCATQLVRVDEAGRHALSDFGEDATADASEMVRFRAVFVFENNRLVAVDAPPARQLGPAPPGELRQAWIERMIQSGARSVWPVAPGRLPLSDGAGVVERVNDGEHTAVATACKSLAPRPASAERRFDEAGFFQGLALLPFAVRLPGLNAERERDAREGPLLFAQARPGERLPDGARGFVADRPGTRLYRDPEDPDYGVIVVSFGWDERNNVGRYNDVAMIGVRADTVVWTADPEAVDALGLRSPMCLGVDGRLDQVRPGCSNTGVFTFGD